ncbi:alpha/beta hydrolase [Nonomuraea sp. NPDC050404]|uniref:alpha/beta hydrolase n=1 Tax=Nonomuraea sp. NPDC050404 TaxID=3155783 RepID=UPI0034026618
MKKPLATLLVGAVVLTACGTGQTPAPAGDNQAGTGTGTGTVAWSKCTDLVGPDGKVMTPGPGVECGRIPVPLDHAEPDGEKIDLALIRVKATGDRLGSLVFNFGGPGASGVDTMAQAASAFAKLGSRYDLVSFDPRGVERSSGVRCGGQLDKIFAAGQGADQEALAKEFVAACEQDSGKILPHVGTVNAAKDLDLLRAALGDRQLNYFGLSYGTHLGSVYATHFPKNVGRFVLDGAFDPKVTFEERAVIQATGFDHALRAFAEDCVAQSCELGADAAAVEKTVEDFVEGLKTKPIKVGERELTYGLGQYAVITPLYAKQSWQLLEQATAAALNGNATILLTLADAYLGRRPDGTYTTAMSSLMAINCADNAERPTAADAARLNERVEKIFPILSFDGVIGSCAGWPVKGDDAAKRIDATGSAPIVVIGGKGDPATPYQWSTTLTEQLRTGVLVTYEGEGHGAYLTGDACVMRTVDAYVLEGKVPAKGTTCAV